MTYLIIGNKLVEKAFKWELMKASFENINTAEAIKLMDNAFWWQGKIC